MNSTYFKSIVIWHPLTVPGAVSCTIDENASFEMVKALQEWTCQAWSRGIELMGEVSGVSADDIVHSQDIVSYTSRPDTAQKRVDSLMVGSTQVI